MKFTATQDAVISIAVTVLMIAVVVLAEVQWGKVGRPPLAVRVVLWVFPLFVLYFMPFDVALLLKWTEPVFGDFNRFAWALGVILLAIAMILLLPKKSRHRGPA